MRQLLCFTLIAALLFSLTACGVGESHIVGIWEQEMEVSILGVEGSGSAVSVARFTFREDGTGTQEQIISDGTHPNVLRDFSYSLDGDVLALNYGENQTEEFTVVLKGTSLILENRRGNYELIEVE